LNKIHTHENELECTHVYYPLCWLFYVSQRNDRLDFLKVECRFSKTWSDARATLLYHYAITIKHMLFTYLRWKHRIVQTVLCSSFNETYHYQHVDEGPILTNTIVTLSPKTGDVLSSWGAGFFYMPHGITIDHQGNVWVTDVAMHQVFKVKKNRSVSCSMFLFSHPEHAIPARRMFFSTWCRRNKHVLLTAQKHKNKYTYR